MRIHRLPSRNRRVILAVCAVLLVATTAPHVCDGFVPGTLVGRPQQRHHHQQQQQREILKTRELPGVMTALTRTRRPKRDEQRRGPRTTATTTTTTTALFGIPKMFRWLTDQYPEIVNRQLEEGLSPDMHVDHFYLDMNGIIHPCTHGNEKGGIVLLDETAMFKKIFLYVDRLYKLVQPSKSMYLAVDGVAPRAKMNQQRSRRFRSAKEAEVAAGEAVALAQAEGGKLPPELETTSKRFDSNCITPGTDFMLKLSLAMRKWVEFKMETDPLWKTGTRVIFSGPDTPGEGEHKVMDHIRKYKNLVASKGADGEESSSPSPYYAPGDTHVLYGLDADLIMLGLVTHEPRFMLLREKMSVVMAGRGGGRGRGRGRGRGGKHQRKPKDMLDYDKNDFEVLELSSLRQMLALQFRRFADPGALSVPYRLDRVVDDFVFMCMLVGNDFLPHSPHLEIDGGAISLMMGTYVELLPEWGDYLTHKEKIHPRRFEEFVYHLAAHEEEHFRRRGYEENESGWKLFADNEEDPDDFYGTFYSGQPTPSAAVPANAKECPPEPAPEQRPMAATGNRSFRRQHPENYCRSYRDFYYQEKLGWRVEDRRRTLFRRRRQVRDYLEGLHWVLHYYHKGVPSWDWYFPHLYSPLATDMVNLNEFYEPDDNDADNDTKAAVIDDGGFATFAFDKGQPFPELAQLLAVLPPQSASLLPAPLAELMLRGASPLKHFYPPDFSTDPNGKRQSWEAVTNIPFIDADLLLDTVQRIMDADRMSGLAVAGDDHNNNKKKEQLLTNAERRRNVRGQEHFFEPPSATTTTEDHGSRDDDNENRPRELADVTTRPARRRGQPPRTRIEAGNFSEPNAAAAVVAPTTATKTTETRGSSHAPAAAKNTKG